MITELIKNEWKALLRNRVMFLVGIFFMITLAGTCWISKKRSLHLQQLYQTAQEHVRKQWDNMGATNPHNAVHFGTYAFKPHGIMSSIDEGVDAVTGNILRLEGHVQNEMEFSEVSQSLVVSSFGKLTPSLLLQYVIPLLLIFLSFSSISGEREFGRLKLLVIQGIPVSKLILCKSLAILLIGALMLVAGLLLQGITHGGAINSDTIIRLTLLFTVYLSFYFILILLSMLFSALMKTSTAALSIILATWVVWTIFLPKIFGLMSENGHPLPSRQVFNAAMKTDREQGIDGHAPTDKRQESLKKQVLKQYGVDSLEQLPINLDGLVMQADEEYGNQVWDKHFGNTYQILKKQKRMYQVMGLMDPFIALQNLSMGLCGSDLFHHQDFLMKAEHYRRQFIKALNEKHAYGGSKSGDWNWKAEEEFYRSIADFDYSPPFFKQLFHYYWMDIVITLIWIAVLLMIVLKGSHKTKVI